jgi:hypothetical protein
LECRSDCTRRSSSCSCRDRDRSVLHLLRVGINADDSRHWSVWPYRANERRPHSTRGRTHAGQTVALVRCAHSHFVRALGGSNGSMAALEAPPSSVRASVAPSATSSRCITRLGASAAPSMARQGKARQGNAAMRQCDRVGPTECCAAANAQGFAPRLAAKQGGGTPACSALVRRAGVIHIAHR